jgi:N-acyl-D-amino-acid deacylase
VDELITIARAAGVPAEIYHLKAAGASNWPKMDQAIAKIEAARKEGLRITADMYTYTADPPASTPASRPGRARAATTRCSSASRIRPRERA